MTDGSNKICSIPIGGICTPTTPDGDDLPCSLSSICEKVGEFEKRCLLKEG